MNVFIKNIVNNIKNLNAEKENNFLFFKIFCKLASKICRKIWHYIVRRQCRVTLYAYLLSGTVVYQRISGRRAVEAKRRECLTASDRIIDVSPLRASNVFPLIVALKACSPVADA